MVTKETSNTPAHAIVGHHTGVCPSSLPVVVLPHHQPKTSWRSLVHGLLSFFRPDNGQPTLSGLKTTVSSNNAFTTEARNLPNLARPDYASQVTQGDTNINGASQVSTIAPYHHQGTSRASLEMAQTNTTSNNIAVASFSEPYQLRSPSLAHDQPHALSPHRWVSTISDATPEGNDHARPNPRGSINDTLFHSLSMEAHPPTHHLPSSSRDRVVSNGFASSIHNNHGIPCHSLSTEANAPLHHAPLFSRDGITSNGFVSSLHNNNHGVPATNTPTSLIPAVTRDDHTQKPIDDPKGGGTVSVVSHGKERVNERDAPNTTTRLVHGNLREAGTTPDVPIAIPPLGGTPTGTICHPILESAPNIPRQEQSSHRSDAFASTNVITASSSLHATKSTVMDRDGEQRFGRVTCSHPLYVQRCVHAHWTSRNTCDD